MKRALMAILIISGTLLGIPAPVLADEAGSGKKNKMVGWPIRWKATSPAIHEGDRYTLLVTNTDHETQEVRIRTVIMDHSAHTNTDVLDEQVELEPREEREFTAVNDYGTANHFNTLIGSETQDLALAVSIADAEGTETARFNEKAFLAQEGKAKGNGAKAKAHTHEEGFAALVPTTLRDTARLSPLPLGVLAVAGIGLFAVRRRLAWAGFTGGGLAGHVALPPAWKAAAVGGLTLSAALHVGLAPVHFGEAAAQEIFFYAASVISAIIAAAILAWPSRPAYLAGAGISLSLIVLWAVFLLVPPPGAEAAEAVDLVGLFTKGTELVAATACIVLWLRARNTHEPDRTEP